jgi:hypothetical protein
MSNKKNNKVPKSDKTRLSDLTPTKQARGGKLAPGGNPAPTPPYVTPPVAAAPKKHLTL